MKSILRTLARGASVLVRLGCFGLSLLSVFKAPTSLLWMAAIGVTEWGHALAGVALLPLLGDRRPGWQGRVSSALSLATIALALSPLVRAQGVARALDQQLEDAFGPATPLEQPGAAPRQTPLSYLDLVRGVALPAVRRETMDYVVRDGAALQLDLYRPAGSIVGAPCVVVVHGGSWQRGARGDLAELNSYLAARGYVVAAISYRFAPAHPFPAPYEDVQAAVAYLQAHAARLGLDPGRIALLGRSAGGHLALLAAYAQPGQGIRGVVALYPPTDLVYGYENPVSPLVHDSRGSLTALLGGAPGELGALYRRASPVAAVGPETPPTLLIHGARDELVRVDHSRMLAERLRQAGRPHLLLELSWATHGADYNFSGPSGQISTYAIERFLAAVLR